MFAAAQSRLANLTPAFTPVCTAPQYLVDKLSCGVCKDIAVNAQQFGCRCTTLVCGTCVENMRASGRTMACPFCRHPSDVTTQNVFACSFIGDLTRRCHWHTNGCTHEPAFADIDHEKTCPFAHVNCSTCHAVILGSEIAAHNETCLVHCLACDGSFPATEYEAHILADLQNHCVAFERLALSHPQRPQDAELIARLHERHSHDALRITTLRDGMEILQANAIRNDQEISHLNRQIDSLSMKLSTERISVAKANDIAIEAKSRLRRSREREREMEQAYNNLLARVNRKRAQPDASFEVPQPSEAPMPSEAPEVPEPPKRRARVIDVDSQSD